MSEIAVRFAGAGDEEALAWMIDAMDAYYQDAPKTAGQTLAAAQSWLGGKAGTTDTRFVLAFAGEQAVGFACFALLHPGNALTGLLFLKDLFVAEGWRSAGAGRRIMAFLAAYCAEHGIGRIDWSVENDRAQRFYENFGAEIQAQKRFMRLDGAALAALAADKSSG